MGSNLAFLDLVFPESANPDVVSTQMEHEFRVWVNRFNVPIFATAYDAEQSVIPLEKYTGSSHLMGYKSPENLVMKWGLIHESDLPADLIGPDYLKEVYKELPFRIPAEVREKARLEARRLRRFASTVTFLTLVIPLLIAIVGLIEWVGYFLSAISILAGLYKIFRWKWPSKRAQEKAEKLRKMEHYFYHCERNSEGFNGLKAENFRRDFIKQTQKDYREIREQNSGGS